VGFLTILPGNLQPLHVLARALSPGSGVHRI